MHHETSLSLTVCPFVELSQHIYLCLCSNISKTLFEQPIQASKRGSWTLTVMSGPNIVDILVSYHIFLCAAQDHMQCVYHHESWLCWQIRAARQPQGSIQDGGYDGARLCPHL